jgi:hypothetical protein
MKMNEKEFRKQWFGVVDEDNPFEPIERIIYLKSGDIILSYTNLFKIEHRKEGNDVYFYSSDGLNIAVIRLKNMESVRRYNRYRGYNKGE